jgi:hypothetical protein
MLLQKRNCKRFVSRVLESFLVFILLILILKEENYVNELVLAAKEASVKFVTPSNRTDDSGSNVNINPKLRGENRGNSINNQDSDTRRRY